MLIEVNPAVIKRQAKQLSQFLGNEGLSLQHSRLLEGLSQAYGYANWRTAQAVLTPIPEELGQIASDLMQEERTAPLFHSLIETRDCSPAVLANRDALARADDVAAYLKSLLGRYAVDSGEQPPERVDDWSYAVGELASVYARRDSPPERNRRLLELVAEATQPFTCELKLTQLFKHAPVQLYEHHFKATSRFFNRFTSNSGTGEYWVEWFNQLQGFAKMLIGELGLVRHKSSIRGGWDGR